jgi:hypothetical protein
VHLTCAINSLCLIVNRIEGLLTRLNVGTYLFFLFTVPFDSLSGNIFHNLLVTSPSIPKADEEFDEDSVTGKKMKNAIEVNELAYTELLL